MKTKLRYLEDRDKEDFKDPKFRKYYEQYRQALAVGYEIAKLRHRLKLSQAELARRMGTTQQVISRLESGSYMGVTLKTLERLAKATGTELTVSFKTAHKKQVA